MIYRVPHSYFSLFLLSTIKITTEMATIISQMAVVAAVVVAAVAAAKTTAATIIQTAVAFANGRPTTIAANKTQIVASI
jgi:hypothetical protein